MTATITDLYTTNPSPRNLLVAEGYLAQTGRTKALRIVRITTLPGLSAESSHTIRSGPASHPRRAWIRSS